MSRFLLPIGRVLLSLPFIISGLDKIFSWNVTEEYLVSRGIPAPGLLLVIAATIEMFGGGMLAIGLLPRSTALVLTAYLVPVTLLLRPLGFLQGPQVPDPSDVLKNLAIMGGLVVLAAYSPAQGERYGRAR